MTTREVRAGLGLSQQRVSQLVKSGAIVADRDADGRLRYDRVSVERYTADRAARLAIDPAAAEERRALQLEARERAARDRRARERAEAERLELLDRSRERSVRALERIAVALERVATAGD